MIALVTCEHLPPGMEYSVHVPVKSFGILLQVVIGHVGQLVNSEPLELLNADVYTHTLTLISWSRYCLLISLYSLRSVCRPPNCCSNEESSPEMCATLKHVRGCPSDRSSNLYLALQRSLLLFLDRVLLFKEALRFRRLLKIVLVDLGLSVSDLLD